MDKNPSLLQNDGFDGFDGFDGSRRWVFGVREMCKNPILWTTLTGLTGLAGLTGLTERSRMLNGKNNVPKFSKPRTLDDFNRFNEFDRTCGQVNANSRYPQILAFHIDVQWSFTGSNELQRSPWLSTTGSNEVQ